MFDTHMHCEFSCDSHMTLPEAIVAARKLGLGLILTEHWDYEYPTNPTKFLFDREAYFKKNSSLRAPDVLLGIEIGMQPHLAARNALVTDGYPFDYVIGSMHMMHKKDLYEQKTYTGLSKAETLNFILEDTLACVTSHDNFDALGHIDYICRYWPYADKNMHYEANKEQFDQIFRVLVEKNKPLEINTRRLGDEEAVKLLLPLYKRYKALGGRYCTLGSDSHQTDQIGRRIKLALAMAQECQLTPVYFKERKLYLDKL